MALRDFNSIERALVSFLPSRREIEAAYVFGSVVTGRLRPDSDVDVAVLVSQKVMRRDPFRYRLELMADLTAVLKRDDVDLILLNQAIKARANAYWHERVAQYPGARISGSRSQQGVLHHDQRSR